MHTIRLFTDIDETTLEKLADALADVEDGSDLTIQICSGGGYIYYALGIIDYLRSRKFHTTAEVLGMAASAAALITLACDRIRMAEYASLMLHSAYALGIGTDDPGIQRANDLQLEIIHKRNPGYDLKQLDRDNWLSAKTAKELGLCDEIITSARDIEALCTYYLARISNNKESTMEDNEKKVCAESAEEVKEADEVKAEDGINNDDMLERVVERLEAIEHRLAVLEGEGKKADDIEEAKEAEEGVMARRKALYARLTAPTICPVKAASRPAKSKIDLSGFLN
jgi:ATP-dependent protease ClpP protease subunit